MNLSTLWTRRSRTIRQFKSSGENHSSYINITMIYWHWIIFLQRLESVPECFRPASRRRSKREQPELLRISTAPADASVKISCTWNGGVVFGSRKKKKLEICISLGNQYSLSDSQFKVRDNVEKQIRLKLLPRENLKCVSLLFLSKQSTAMIWLFIHLKVIICKLLICRLRRRNSHGWETRNTFRLYFILITGII